MSDETGQEIARAESEAHDAGYQSGYEDGYAAGLVDGSESAAPRAVVAGGDEA